VGNWFKHRKHDRQIIAIWHAAGRHEAESIKKLTLPAAGLVAALSYELLMLVGLGK